MRNLVIVAALALASCSGNAQQDAAQIQAVEQAAVPLVAQNMCAAQAAANAAGALAEKNGDAKGAQEASMASAAAGIGCSWPTTLAPAAAPAK